MRYQNSTIQQRLASEYVMGTMITPVRRRFEKLLRQYPEMQQYVDDWAERLQPLNDHIEPVTPPDSIWINIRDTIDSPKKHVRSNNPLYRNIAMLAASLLLVISLVFFHAGQQQQPVVYINNKHDEVTWKFELNTASHQIRVKTLARVEMAENKVCVLWLIRDRAKPHKVATLSSEPGDEEIIQSDLLFAQFDNAGIVVTLEPLTDDMDKPSGDIIYRGPWSIL